jgi:hypothetical protein
MIKKIKDYTTTIDSFRTIGEIQELLVSAGATGIAMNYENGLLKSLFFRLKIKDQEFPFKLPTHADKVYLKLFAGRKMEHKLKQDWEKQSLNIAWRIMKDWVEAQLAIIQLEQADALEVFLPYLSCGDKTFYELQKESNFISLMPKN